MKLMNADDFFKEYDKHRNLLKKVKADADNAEDVFYAALDKYAKYSEEEYNANEEAIETELDGLRKKKDNLEEAIQALEENIDYLKRLEDNANWLEDLGLI